MSGGPARLDGGLATSLQALGLPPFTPVEPWVGEWPDRVRRAHRAFVDAGATDLLTATFRLPVHPDPTPTRDRAIELARDAGAARIWLALGPGGDPASVARGARVDGVVLETQVDPGEARRAVRAVRAVWGGPLVVSLLPARALDVGPLARGLVGAGADGVGFNCAPSREVAEAVRALPDEVPAWAKPSGPLDDPLAWDELAARCAWLGGCCGVGPEELRARFSGRATG